MPDYLWGCSSVGRAPALQAGGHEFESHHLHASNEQCGLIKSKERQACLKAMKLLSKHSAKHVMKQIEDLRVPLRLLDIKRCTLKTEYRQR